MNFFCYCKKYYKNITIKKLVKTNHKFLIEVLHLNKKKNYKKWNFHSGKWHGMDTKNLKFNYGARNDLH